MDVMDATFFLQPPRISPQAGILSELAQLFHNWFSSHTVTEQGISGDIHRT